ncbi:hypothetical protein JCM10296v2_004840 [Rhodotorula toruloides]
MPRAFSARPHFDLVLTSFPSHSKPTVGVNGYDGFHPGKTTRLEKGSTREGFAGERTRPLESDILLEHDVELVMCDGANLYCDIYRPADSDEKIPCLIMWSPYGKRYSSINMLPVTTWRRGIRPSDLSNSDGSVQIMGQNMGEDGYDVVELLAKKDWCNGNVGMAGNSFLAISQWHIAAQQPPSLKAIAPWEGCGDLFREQFVRGGVFEISNMDLINKLIIKGNNGTEDFFEMASRLKEEIGAAIHLAPNASKIALKWGLDLDKLGSPEANWVP